MQILGEKVPGKILVFLIFVCLAAFALRTWHISTDLLFHYDQGLHASEIYKIWHDHKISLLGHITDVDGIVHSPVYYWLMLPAYAISHGNPAAASIFQILLETLSLPFLFFAIRYIFSRKTAVLSLILVAASYGMISQSRWLSNVTPIIAFSNLLLFLFAYQLKKGFKPVYVFLSSLMVGIIAQHNAAVGIFLFPFLIWFYRKKLTLRNLALVFGGFLIPAVPLIIFQFRHDFVMVKAIVNYAQTPGKGVGFTSGVFTGNLGVLFNQINTAVAFPVELISLPLFILGLVKLWKNKNRNFIYAYLAIPFLFLGLFQRGAINFFFDALLPLLIPIVVTGLDFFPKAIGYILFAGILVINFSNLPKIYKPTNALIPIGNANVITLQDRKNIIDWMYQKAAGKPFAIWYYTIPFFHEEPWNYLFLTYAQPKYGYLPEATHGFSPNDLKSSKYFFAVYEPEYDDARLLAQRIWFSDVKKNFGEAVATFRSHDLVAELRIIKR